MNTNISQSQEFDFSRGLGEDLRNLLNHTNSCMSAEGSINVRIMEHTLAKLIMGTQCSEN